MEEHRFSRTELLIGKEGLTHLSQKRVAVFGIGGVGGFVCEGLARAGIGAIDLIDDDRVSISNINRQIIALTGTIGRYKVDVMEERLHEINPEIKVVKHQCFYTPKTSGMFHFKEYDYVVDAIDTVTGKIELILQAKEAEVPIISAMGAGNKLDPTRFEITDLFQTSVCPLARVMRRELKKRGIEKVKVIYSREEALTPMAEAGEEPESAVETEERKGNPKTIIPGSMSFVPSVMGLMIAGEVVKELI